MACSFFGVKEDDVILIEKKYIRYHAITLAFTIACAIVVILMRIGFVRSSIITTGEVIMFPFSDFFVILGAGLCGYRYGLILFEIVFWAEIIGNSNSSFSGLFALFLYLVLALIAGTASENGWLSNTLKRCLLFVILWAAISVIFYFVFGILMPIQDIGALDEPISFSDTLIGTFPETALAWAGFPAPRGA